MTWSAPENVVVVVIPTCSYCAKVATECKCGRPVRDGK